MGKGRWVWRVEAVAGSNMKEMEGYVEWTCLGVWSVLVLWFGFER